MNLFGILGQSSLIIGPEQSYASFVVSTAAFDLAADGKSFAIFLCDTPAERNQITERAIQYRRARRLPIGRHLNYRVVDISHCATPEALIAAMRQEIGHVRDVLIVHDRTSKLLPTTPHHHWFPKADALALEFGARVATVAHYGPPGRPAPDLKAYPCDVLWHARPHARAMKCTLHPIKGTGNEPIDFQGLKHGIQGLTFEADQIDAQEQEKEIEHA